MKQKITVLLASLMLVLGVAAAAAPPAAASACVGPGCDSGWAYATCHNPAGDIYNDYANDRTVWNLNGTRTFYYSGYTKDSAGSNWTYKEVRIWFKLNGGTWTLKADYSNPPPYGSWASATFSVASPGSVHYEQAHFRDTFGNWCNAPVITE